jgi:MoxR-like ATPase
MKEKTLETAAEELDLSQVRHLAVRLRAAVRQVVVGKDGPLDLAMVALLAGGHILIQDVPGIGKTTLAKTLAASLGCEFKRIQFTPDLTPADVLGVNIFDQRAQDFEFRPGPVFTQVLLADEINRATPRTQSALLEAMQERQVTVDGVSRPTPLPFLVMATQNPIEMEGTFPLPEAQLDRFMLRIALGYPDIEEEEEILLRFHGTSPPSVAEPVITVEELLEVQELVPLVQVEASVRRYVLEVARATRSHASLEVGASPRAALFLYKAVQSLAAIRGRHYALPDDVKELADPVLAHRLVPTPQARLRGHSAEEAVKDVLELVPVPVES